MKGSRNLKQFMCVLKLVHMLTILQQLVKSQIRGGQDLHMDILGN